MARYEVGGIRPRGNLEVKFDGLHLSGFEPNDILKAYLSVMKTRNSLPAIDWEERLWKELRRAYPKYVHRIKDKGKGPVSVSSAKHFVQFMLKRLRNRKLESTQVAKERAVTCHSCPKHKKVGGCGICRLALKQLVHPPEQVKEIESLKGCEVCGCYMPLKVWVPADLLLPMVDDHPYPENCWMRQLAVPQPPAGDSPPSS